MPVLFPQTFDVIVVGGGHAGTEAALASARMGCRTLLVTHSIDTLGAMSCNPSIGGIGKGHLVKEVDALGGAMALATDAAGIQFRTLNASKGPAVRATRAQADRALYKAHIRSRLETQSNLWLFQQPVDDLLLEGDRVAGVVTQVGVHFCARAVVLTAGTFLDGRIHVGLASHPGGRAGDAPAQRLSARLKELRLPQGRLKTGTPPRLDARSIDFSRLAEQPGDAAPLVFSFMGDAAMHPRQLPCWITHTNAATHEVIRGALDRSPMFTGVIEGVGPRYCPSIEDKVHRFADKTSHQIFLEPEGLDTHEIYPNGISTSLPFDAQLALVHSIAGLEQAHIVRPGYAIEYDYFDPTALSASFGVKAIAGLYFAGQINGTTGYEEAAAQGLFAGANAALHAQGRAPWTLPRDQAYLGVLVDDLTSKGVSEPYRMFTSRAEFRLQLREDNADQRLTPVGRELGLVDDARWAAFCRKRDAVSRETQRLQTTWVHPGVLTADVAEARLGKAIDREYSLASLLRRPGVTYDDVDAVEAHRVAVHTATRAAAVACSTTAATAGATASVSADTEVCTEAAADVGTGVDAGVTTNVNAHVGASQQAPARSSAARLRAELGDALAQAVMEQVEVGIKYAGYINKQQQDVARARDFETLALPADLDYAQVAALSFEVRQKLTQARPATLGQAARLAGVTPAAVSLLLVHLRKHRDRLPRSAAAGAP